MSNLVHRINGGQRLLQVAHPDGCICDRVEFLCDQHEVELDEVANVQFIASELPAIIDVLAAMREPEALDLSLMR